MSDIMWDFVVVGAGPAGSRFARQAAAAGWSVVVFERGEVGEPLACSGHVSLDIWDFVPAGAKQGLKQNEITGARFHIGGADSRAYTFYQDDPISNTIDRVGLDRILAEEAVGAGAELKTHHTVTEVSEHAEHVTVTVVGDGRERQIEGRMVVGCDGPVSRVRDALSLPAPDELLHGVLAFDPEPDESSFVDVHLTVPRFFGWRIPRGDAGVEYGLATTPDNDVGERFATFVEDYGVETENTCSGAIPIGPPSTVTSHRGLLIGDAAGQTKPFTGGGILYGMTAADIAANQVDPTDPNTLQRYEDVWRRELRREIQLGHWLRRAYSFPEPIQRLGLRATAGKIGVHMDRPTSVVSKSHLKATLFPGKSNR